MNVSDTMKLFFMRLSKKEREENEEDYANCVKVRIYT